MAIGQHHAAHIEHRPAERLEGRRLAQFLLHGVVGGVIAGVIFALFEMAVAVLLMGSMSAFWMPLRMIGAIVLGKEALEQSSSIAAATLAGIVVHMALSAAFGAIFALILWGVPALARSAVVLIGAASIYGLLLWLGNFYVIAPLAGWDWFPEGANQLWQGFVAHTFVFGTLLGVYLAAARPGRTAAPTA